MEETRAKRTTKPHNIASPHRTCPECGTAFIATNGAQVFCSSPHRKAFYDVMAIRGKTAIPLLLVQRRGKNGRTEDTAYAMSQLSKLADRWNAEDRQRGRRPDIIVKGKRAQSWMAADLG